MDNFLTADWMSDLETELVDHAAAFIPNCQMNPVPVYASFENLDVNCFSPISYGTDDPDPDPAPRTSTTCETVPSQLFFKNKDFYSFRDRDTQKAKIIAFGDTSSPTANYYDTSTNINNVKIEADHVGSVGEIRVEEDPIISPNSIQKLFAAFEEHGEPVKRIITRTTLQAQQDHVVAERKRREKLSELFVSLSTMIPGLKKLDKASILGGTIEHLKQLEGRLKTLEEKQQKKRKINYEETVVSANTNDHMDPSSSDDTNLDQIEVRASCDGNLLIGVHCSKRKGVIKEILCQVEKLGLCIINSSAIPFGDTTIHISITTQMNEDFYLFGEGLKEKVRKEILKLL